MTSSVSNPRSVDNALVEVQNSRIDRSGKGLFTKRTFGEGEEIWSQKRPLIATLDHLSLSVVCSNCFAQERDVTRGWRSNDTPVVVKACTQCKLLGFCSKKCQAEAWKWHKHDCSGFAKAAPVAYERTRALFENPLCRGLIQLLGMRKGGLVDDEQWNKILGLKAHEEVEGVDRPDFDRKIVLLATDTIKDPNGDENTTYKLLDILKRNSFTLVSNTFDPLGMAFDPLLARVNHDCSNNSNIMFDGARISLRSLTSISSGSEVSISYVDTTYPIHERRLDLEDRWSFICRCHTCSLGEATWRDAFPLKDEMPRQFKDETMRFAQASESPATVLMAIAQKSGNQNLIGLAAMKAKATQLLGDFDRLNNAPVNARIRYLEDAETFFKSSKCWPIYRQGRSEMLGNLVLLYIGTERYLDAMKVAATLYYLVDPIHYPEAHHPLRIIHGLRLLQLITNIGDEASQALPFDVILVLFELARRVVQGAKKSHGENSRLYKAIWERFGTEVLEMQSSAFNISRQELEAKVTEEMEKMKEWAASDEVILSKRSLNAIKQSS